MTIFDIDTSRLVLKPVALADAEQVQVLFPHWEIVKYLNAIVPWPYPPDGVATFYGSVVLPGMERSEQWHWTLRLKTAPEQIIGAVSLNIGDDNRGFWLGLPWHRQGLMTEACDAVTDHGFHVLGFPRLRVGKAIANTGSRRISEKQGMRVVAVEKRDDVCGRLPTEVWEITVEEWRVHRKGVDLREKQEGRQRIPIHEFGVFPAEMVSPIQGSISVRSLGAPASENRSTRT